MFFRKRFLAFPKTQKEPLPIVLPPDNSSGKSISEALSVSVFISAHHRYPGNYVSLHPVCSQ